jgi:hypothetical protein
MSSMTVNHHAQAAVAPCIPNPIGNTGSVMTVDAEKTRNQKNHDPRQTMRPMQTAPHDAG